MGATPTANRSRRSDCLLLASCATPTHLRAFSDIACFAYDRSEYYRRLYDQAGVHPARHRPSDLPTVAARDLASSPLLFRTDERIYRVVAGSGTTGRPKLMFRTADDFARSVGNERQLMEWAGVQSTDVVAIAQAFDLWASGELIQRAAAEIGAMVVPVGLIPDTDALEILAETGCTVLDTTPSRLRRMLVLSASSSLRPPVRVVMVSGEPLPRDMPGLARDIWGAEVFNQYGSEETDGLAANRSPGSNLSLLVDDFVFELLDHEQGLAPGEFVGRLVVTSLYHRGTPLIRYVLDDLVRVDLRDPDRVTILGRASECFFLYDSVKLHPYQVQAALVSAGFDCMRWQCMLESRDGRDHLTLRYITCESARSFEHPSVLRSVMQRCTYEVEGLVSMGDLDISVERVDSLSDSRRGKTARFLDARPASMVGIDDK